MREEKISSQVLFKGHFLNAYRDQVRLADGKTASREYVTHPGAVVVMAELDTDSADSTATKRWLMERQFRYPVNQVMVEFPAGKLDAGEDPLWCAQRELKEETGYTAREWAYVGALHLAIAYSTEVIHIFAARGMKAGAQKLDVDEHLEVFSATLDEMLGWVREGKLTDAKTCTCLLWLQNLERNGWSLNWQSV